MDEIHVHKTKKSICAHFAESPCNCMKTDGTVFPAKYLTDFLYRLFVALKSICYLELKKVKNYSYYRKQIRES